MKILHLTNNYPTKSFPIFGIFVQEQILSLDKLGIKNEVFFINSREHGKKEYFYSYFKLIKVLFTKKYDLIHCHHAFSSILFLMSGFAFFNNFIVSYQSDPKIEGGEKLFKLILKFNGIIILKNKITKYFTFNNVHYLPNGIDINFFKPMNKFECKKKLGLKNSIDYIIFLDSYVKRPYKRVDRFDSVLEILKSDYKIKNIDSLKLTNTERKVIPLYFNAAKVHLLTSDIEGSPNSVKESLACNIPVVSTDVGNVKEMISDIEGCYVSASFDPKELAFLVNKSLSNQDFNGRNALIRKNLTIDKVAANLKLIYCQILKREC